MVGVLTLRIPTDMGVVDPAVARSIARRLSRRIREGDRLRLEIVGVSFTLDGVKMMAKFLSLIADCVVQVKMSSIAGHGNLMPVENGHTCLAILCTSLADAPIEMVDFSDNVLGAEGLTRVQDLLQKTGIETVVMQNAMLDAAAMHFLLTEVYAVRPAGLKKLCLSDNCLSGEDGATSVGNLISTCTSLAHFEYARNEPDRKGSKQLLKGLTQAVDNENVFLYLDLQGCDFTTSNFDKLTGMLRDLSSLANDREAQVEHIDVSSCNIHTSGVNKLKRILERDNPEITLLTGSNSQVEDFFEDFSQRL